MGSPGSHVGAVGSLQGTTQLARNHWGVRRRQFNSAEWSGSLILLLSRRVLLTSGTAKGVSLSFSFSRSSPGLSLGS